MIISVTSSAQTKKSNKPAKRTTPSIYKKKKVRVKGYVDRISNGIVVVVIRNPKDNESVREIFVPESKFPKRIPEEGDYVSVTVNIY
ncbi:MAG: hypothetical protein IKQ33_05680 [Clostridia bacterium]|nr:hypothetical protein [Clostridia bacterium]